MLVSQGRCRRGKISKFQSERKADGSFERRHLIVFDNRDSMWIDLALQISEESLWLDTPAGAYGAEEVMQVEAYGGNHYNEASEEIFPETLEERNDTKKRSRQTSSKLQSNTAPRQSSSFNQQMTKRKVPKHSHPGASLKPSTPSRPRQRQETVLVSPDGPMHASADSDAYDFSKSEHQGYNEASERNNEWLERFEYWLLNIPHGRTDKACSQDNAKNVLKQVKKLVLGDGIGYRHWPSHVKFYEGVKVNLGFDFDKMHCEAKAYECRYGRDKVRFVRRSIS